MHISNSSSTTQLNQVASHEADPLIKVISYWPIVAGWYLLIRIINLAYELGINELGTDDKHQLSEYFISQRDSIYQFIAVYLVIIAVFLIINRKKAAKYQILIWRASVGLIFVTFSYAIAGVIVDLLRLL